MTDVELANDLRIPVAEVRRLDHEIHPRYATVCKLAADLDRARAARTPFSPDPLLVVT